MLGYSPAIIPGRGSQGNRVYLRGEKKLSQAGANTSPQRLLDMLFCARKQDKIFVRTLRMDLNKIIFEF